MKKSTGRKFATLMSILAFGVVTMATSMCALAADNIDIGTFRNIVTGNDPNSILTTELSVQNQAKTGWQKINNDWYYFDKAGKMQIGWLNDNGTWYYFNQSGTMVHDTTISGYYLDNTGAWVK